MRKDEILENFSTILDPSDMDHELASKMVKATQTAIDTGQTDDLDNILRELITTYVEEK